jgi:hypothetical protein
MFQYAILTMQEDNMFNREKFIPAVNNMARQGWRLLPGTFGASVIPEAGTNRILTLREVMFEREVGE